MSVRGVLLVGAGGAVGAVLRALASAWLTRPGGYPLGTLAVNVIGCFAIGALAGVGEARAWLTEERRLFLLTGLLGGFTTYSAFAHEVVRLAAGREARTAALHLVSHLVLGGLAVLVGARLAGALAR